MKPTTKLFIGIGGLILASVLLLPSFFKKSESSTALPDVVDYNFHIKPIISDRCFKCHGPDAQKREADCGWIPKKDCSRLWRNTKTSS